MKCGIVGPPQSGKSTLFSILTGIVSENFEVSKRETQLGVAQLHDTRLDQLSELWKSRKITYATIEYLDVPGRTGSSGKPEPYPASYLSELRGADMLALVIRDFEEPTIPHPSGSIDPSRDLADATLEFIVNDLDVTERRLNRLSKMHDDESRREQIILEKCREALSENKHLRDLEFTADEMKMLKGFSFLSLKPLMIVLNQDEDKIKNAAATIESLQKQLPELDKRVRWLSVAAGIELEILQLDEEERTPFLEELGFSLPALDRVIEATFDLLGLMTFLTVGPKEGRAWTVREGSTAVQAARVIHEDIARGFIRAEIYQWSDMMEAGSEAQLKKNAKMRLEGKDYIVRDGDVMNVRFNI